MSDLSTSFIKGLAGKPKPAPKQDKVNAYFKKLVQNFYKEFGDKSPFVVSRLYEKGKEDTTDDKKDPVKLSANNVQAAIEFINSTASGYKMERGNGGYYIKKTK